MTAPGGRAVHVDARIALASLSGPWSDSAGNSGTFAFNASTGGGPRPLPAVTLLANGGFLAGGQSSTAVIPASGAGTRMMFYPGKAAFRVGNVTNDAWDDVNIGLSSAALGTNTNGGPQGARSADSDWLQRENEALRAELRALAALVEELRATRRTRLRP